MGTTPALGVAFRAFAENLGGDEFSSHRSTDVRTKGWTPNGGVRVYITELAVSDLEKIWLNVARDNAGTR